MPMIPMMLRFTLSALLFSLYLPGQNQPVILKSTTRLVQLSVVVQDHKGVPVATLKKEDFQVRDNGKPQTIAEFSVESNGKLPSAPEKLPPNIFTNELEQRTGTPSSVTIILLDALNTKWEDQAYAKAQVVKFLQTIQPQDRVGIYTLGRSLRVLHDFTTDSSALLERLNHFSGENLPDLAASEPAAMDNETVALNDWIAGRGGASGVEADFYTQNRVLGTLHTLEFIANHLARLPGRKNLIWVSGGFPLDIGFDSVEQFRDPSREHRTFADDIDRTVRAVNNANLAIYPVDARGLVVDQRFSAANQKIDLAPKAGMGPIVKNQETMRELASRTGGRAYYNTNDLQNAIRDAIGDSQVTYTIGYYPASETFDGKFHKLDVKLANSQGFNIRYRKGYFDQPEQPQDDKARKVELRDAVFSPLDASALGLVISMQPNQPDPGQVTVLVKVDQKGLSLQPNGERWVGRLDLLFIQKDESGRQYGGLDDRLDLNLTEANYQKLMKEGLVYKKTLKTEAKASQLRVVVRDSASGSLGSVTIPFRDLHQAENSSSRDTKLPAARQ